MEEDEKKEETPEIPEEKQPLPPPRGVLWIQMQYDTEKGHLFFTTNVKESVTWLGMVELARASFLENHFKHQRKESTAILIPKNSLLRT